MSYHDQPPDYMRKGIAVVNPLLRIEKQLRRVKEVLNNISEKSPLTAHELKKQIQEAMEIE